jgi:hypothetical protein
MADYYYKKEAGWVYTYENTQRIWNTSGDLVSTLQGADDIVTTMGFDGFAPNNDSLFRVEVKYRVRTSYNNNDLMNIRFVCEGNSQHGAFIDGSSTISGEKSMGKRPRPVSTDTIIAGVAGRVRTIADDFTNNASSVWKKDTLWFTSRGDSVFIWERMPGRTALTRSRLLFCKNFSNNLQWGYDLTDFSGQHPTNFKVKDPDQSITTDAGTFNHAVKIAVITPEVDDNMPIHEHKYFAVGVGLVHQQDDWFVTTDGVNRNKQEYIHTLVSLQRP